MRSQYLGGEAGGTMAKTDFKSVDDYIKTHPEEVQAILQRVRKAIRKALPGALETALLALSRQRSFGQSVQE